MSDSTDVLIVGGGVAGMALSIALSKRRLASVVVEKTLAAGDIDRGDVIHRAGVRLLEGWGVLPELLSTKPLVIRSFRIVSPEGEQLFNFDFARDLSAPAELIVLRHPDIQRVLESAVESSSFARVLRGTSARHLMSVKGRIAGVMTDRGPLFARLTVVASGSASQFIAEHIRRDVYDYKTAFLNLRCGPMFDQMTCATYVIGHAQVLVVLPLPHNELRLGIQQRGSQNVPVRRGTSLKNYVPLGIPGIYCHDLRVIDSHLYRLRRVVSRHLSIPGLVVIGDAAHTVHPIGGQGMTLAFQDAECLAELLSHGSLSEDDLDKSCSSYESVRRKQMAPVLSRTHLMGKIAGPVGQWGEPLNGLLLRIATLSGLSRSIFERIVDCR